MMEDVYGRLAEALGRLPNGFPRTQSGVEIAILKRIFSAEEAAIGGILSIDLIPSDIIAKLIGLGEEEVSSRLRAMARRGLVWSEVHQGKTGYRLAPFVVGIYEAQLENMDHEFAHLVEDYFDEGGIVGIMKPQPAIHRVIPARGSVKTEWILPYDDVKAILLSNKTFRVRDCICRKQQDFIGRKCSFPLKTCLSFSAVERPLRPGEITLEEALAVLDKAEEIGLVHTVSNVMKGVGYVCNCCGCCCGILRGITEFGIRESVANANYYSEIEADKCIGCGNCTKRCQVHAISFIGNYATVDHEKCIGCGLCVTGCPAGAAKLQRKPEKDIVHPPTDYETWEKQRLRNRVLK